jgi:hypothetical protein
LKKSLFLFCNITAIILLVLKLINVFLPQNYFLSNDNKKQSPLWESTDKLVLIIVDGVPRKILSNKKYYPAINSLTSQGHLIGHHKLSPGITTTMPVVKLMATGSEGKITDLFQNFKSKEHNGDSVLRQLSLSGKTVAVYGEAIWSDLFSSYLTKNHTNHDSGFANVEKNDKEAFEAVLNSSLKEDFNIIHFVGTDKVGHLYNIEDEKYIRYSKVIDNYILKIIKKYNNHNFIIAADHGISSNRSHIDSADPQVNLPPILFFGNQFKKEIIPEFTTNQFASTISYFFGIIPPISSSKIPYLDIFKTENLAQSKLFQEQFAKNLELLKKEKIVTPKNNWKDLSKISINVFKNLENSRSIWIYAIGIFISLTLILVLLNYEYISSSYIGVGLLVSAISILLTSSIHIISLVLLLLSAFLLWTTIKNSQVTTNTFIKHILPFIPVFAISLPFWMVDSKFTKGNIYEFLPYLIISTFIIVICTIAAKKNKYFLGFTFWSSVWFIFYFGDYLKIIGIFQYCLTFAIFVLPFVLMTKTKFNFNALAGTLCFFSAFLPRLLFTGLPNQRGLGRGPMMSTASHDIMLLSIGIICHLLLLFFIFWKSDEPPVKIFTISLLSLLGPSFMLLSNGYHLELIFILVCLGLFIFFKEKNYSLIFLLMVYWTLGSELQIISFGLFLIGTFIVLNNIKLPSVTYEKNVIFFLMITGFYFTGNSFSMSGIENTLFNIDLILPPAFWLTGTIFLICLKTMIPILGVLTIKNIENIEKKFIYFCAFSVPGVIFLFSRDYVNKILVTLPIILMFAFLIFLMSELINYKRKKQ